MFPGTRIPAHLIADSVAAGEPLAEILEAYPSLTAVAVDLARLYVSIRPERPQLPTLMMRDGGKSEIRGDGRGDVQLAISSSLETVLQNASNPLILYGTKSGPKL